MRSPHYYSVAVRLPSGKIRVRSRVFRGLGERFPFLKRPVLRGVVGMLESMALGMRALNLSAAWAEAEATPRGDKESAPVSGSSLAIAATMAVSIAIAMGLFVALPHGLAAWWTGRIEGFAFHVVDGLIKMAVLLAYVYAIGWMKDIYRVFQYHGAEHQSIYAFEAGEPLTVDSASKQTRLHPRCGTSFLLFVVLVSVGVFTIVFPVFGVERLLPAGFSKHFAMIGIKIGLMLPVAGLAYEVIKFSAKHQDRMIMRAIGAPGMWLQNLTTRPPEQEHLAVALVALKQVLALETGTPKDKRAEEPEDFEVAAPEDVQESGSSVAEFAET